MTIGMDHTLGYPALGHGVTPWAAAVTPRPGGFVRVRRSVRVAAQALWRETAPPD
jgi:hypothetical protein